jgi:uncharacterized protein (TIGR02266 family)
VDVELNKTESELQSEESALHAELTRLAAVAVEVSSRMESIRRRAEANGDGMMVQRNYTPTPKLDENLLLGARAARAAAVKARQETNARARKELADAKKKLHQLAQQTVADEKELHARESAPPPAKTQPIAPVAPAPVSSPPRPTPLGRISPPGGTKRQSPRVKMQAAVDFTSDNNFFNGFSANISDGGLFVATVNLLPLGTEVDLAFTLPSGARVEAKGVVRWVREVNDAHPDVFPGLGVQFSALHPQAQEAIDQFLAQRDPLFFAAE